MSYNDQIIDQVQSLNDIVEVISSYVPLKRAGRNFKATCPFHQEKTPSFMVNPDKQIYHCFGCGAGGDIFSFLMKYEQMNFPEALKHLAERVNVVLPESKFNSDKQKSQHDKFYQIYAAASDFYQANLKHPEFGKAPRQYLAKRAFGEKEIELFRLGFALSDWRTLYEHLSKKGFSEQDLFKSGLISRNAQGKTFDLFRNRVMFPILNTQGKVVAFGGRVMDDETPKYLNSPENPVFQKRREMYGLYLAKKAISTSEELRRILIVEGYFGCIRLHANGFSNTVATLGTSLTPDHVQVLKRYADEAIVIFDGDKAGEAASLRSLDLFLEEAMAVKVSCLPKGFDPDDLIREQGRTAMERLIEQRQDVFDFKLQILLKRFSKSDSLGLLKITSEFLETFAKIKSPVLVDRYLKKLALTLGVEEASLRSELNKLKVKQQTKPVFQEETVSREAQKAEPAVEKLLISLILHYPPYFHLFTELFPDYSFVGERSRKIFQLCGQILNRQERFSATQLLARIQEAPLKDYASELLLVEWPSGGDRETAFQDVVRTIRNSEREGKLRDLRNQISRAEQAGDQNALLRYMKEYQELLVAPSG